MKKNKILKAIFFLLLLDYCLGKIENEIKISETCPNTPLTDLGIISKFSSIKESYYQSTLSEEDRKSYEDMISLKRAFSSSMTFIPQSFSPERQTYWDGLQYLVFTFFMISLFPLFFILFYLIMRFLVKKCTGPRKISEITRLYRNSTWVLLFVSSITLIVLFSIILGYSSKTNSAIRETFNEANNMISKSESLYDQINDVVKEFRKEDLEAPSELFMSSFQKNIESYITETKKNTDQILGDDKAREIGMVLLYIYYIIVLILSLVFFFLRWQKAEGFLAILMLLTIPAMMIFEGYNAKFFFYYGDLCDSVNGALYSNQFPVAGQSLGFYYNCFPKDTKAQLYSIRYTLYNSATNAPEGKFEIKNKYNALNENVLQPQLNCELVTKVVPKIESEFCKNSLEYMYNLLLLMSWLLLITIVLALTLRRLEVLIWKKKNEIESMIDNIESVY